MTTRSLLGDAALAIALASVGVLVTATSDSWGLVPDRPIDTLGLALVASAALVLVVRRRWPLAVLAANTPLVAAYLVMGYPYGPVLFTFFVAVYTVARHRPLPASVPAALAALMLLLAHLFTNSAALPAMWGILPASAWVAVPFAIGTTARVNREAAARARAEVIRQRVDDERLRIAQDVHDIVGHGLAAIRMQADVALHVLPKKPEQAVLALDAISRTSGEALDELRATLGAIPRDDAGREPPTTPRLTQLDELVDRMRDAGLRVEVETVGERRALPPVVDLTGYRIVQESLTNVLRHSDAKDATVRLLFAPDSIGITISNRAPGSAAAGGGLGISGMRRRVASLGGDFVAGPTAGDRFEVRASIPTGGGG